MRGLLLATLLSLFSLAALADIPVPHLQRPVTDLTHTLSDAQRAELESQLRALEQRKGAQVAVLILPTTGPESIEGYATRVFKQWQLGRKEIDDGVLLLVAKDDRALRIEVGYGLEGAVSDVSAGRIIREQITPAFRNGGFYAGIQAGITSLIALIDGEALPAPASGAVNDQDSVSGFSFLLFIAQFIAVPFLTRLIPRPWARTRSAKRYLLGIAALFGFSLLYSLVRGAAWNYALFFGMTAGFIGLFIYALILLPLGSVSFSSSGGGSSGSSRRSGGGSGGGFSGGGGSSGGGGASGRW